MVADGFVVFVGVEDAVDVAEDLGGGGGRRLVSGVGGRGTLRGPIATLEGQPQ